MPTEDDYARRQLALQHASSTSPAPVAVSCPQGCPAASNDHLQAALISDRFQHQDRLISERFTSEKNLPDRFDGSDRFQQVPDRFGSERSSSDRLPSGERYQGVSERFPLGERPATAVSSDRLAINVTSNDRQTFQPERYHYTTERASCQRSTYQDRFTPIQNLGSLDRYNHALLDRYSRTSTPTDRYHTLSGADKERCSSASTDRYTPIEKYEGYSTADRHASSQSVCSIERYTPTERNHRNPENYHSGSKTLAPDMYKRERSGSSDRKHKYSHDPFTDRFAADRFPAIPCPERFASQESRPERPERIPFSQVPYLEPPSPAPASDRFIPPPPLSPTNTPSPDCYNSNAFPSPTTNVPPPDRFIPPPPLSPSPTENYSPKKMERYERRYSSSPSPAGDRYQNQYGQDRRGFYTTGERYQNSHHPQPPPDKFINVPDRFSSPSDRYVPPNAHMPVERYVPQQQEPYYGTAYPTYDRYQKYQANNGDPYMRRDLGYHYRLPVPYPQNQYQRMRYTQMGTPSRIKCCPYQEGYQLSKSSPGSSSSSSVTSQGKEMQNFHQSSQKEINNASLQEISCQNYQGQCNGYQQEKAIQCSNFPPNKEVQCSGFHIAPKEPKDSCVSFASPNLRKSQCRHGICASPSVEYVGQSGGRLVCATPPPRGSVGSGDIALCSDQCCTRRSQNTLAVTVWRTTPTPQQQPQQTSQPVPQSQQPAVTPTAQQSPQQPTSTTQQQNVNKPPSPTNDSQHENLSASTQNVSTESHSQSLSHASTVGVQSQQVPSPKSVQPLNRAVSLPVSPPERYRTLPEPGSRVGGGLNYSQSERIPGREWRRFARSTSRKEAIKNYIKRETANFFGVDEDNEADRRVRWLDRRKRLASRTYGALKEEYREPSSWAHRRTLSEVSGVIPQGQLHAGRPDVLPGPSDVPDTTQDRYTTGLRRKDSVARMTWDGLSYVVTTITRHRPRPRSQTSQWSRSYAPEVARESLQLEDEVFFDRASTSPSSPQQIIEAVDNRQPENESLEPLDTANLRRYRQAAPGWRRDKQFRINERDQRPAVGGSRIFTSMLDRVLDNSDRRQYGMGWVGRMFGRSMRKSVSQDEKIQEQLDDMEDYRPMFTYWVTTVQILVLIISLFSYGFGPFGLNLAMRQGQVLVTSLSLQEVEYMEPANFWFGPRAADLIHLGAKFAPCMRVDTEIRKTIDQIRKKERETACCIRNDDSGCVQSTENECSVRGLMPMQTISTWKKWGSGEQGPGGRMSGSVCGLDPKFCDRPKSQEPHQWPDDITKWPICRKTKMTEKNKMQTKDKSQEHMVCEVIGHPCCIGIHGLCKITTKEYCDFVKGTFHDEASLCSQVSCLNDVCGMIPFYFPETPDQFYRLFTSLFLHAGILQLLITVIIQYFLMRDLEKLTGSLRIGIIYLGSGIAGNLASAIFIPHRADVGPAGSQFGLLACLIVEVLNAWPMLKHPNQALCKLISITFILFLIGLLPWVDNYAHLFGFVFGFLLSYALLPFVSFGPYDRQKKIVLIWVCLLSAAFLFICLVLLFYIIPIYNCEVCSYFNCIPLTRDFCASQNIDFKTHGHV